MQLQVLVLVLVQVRVQVRPLLQVWCWGLFDQGKVWSWELDPRSHFRPLEIKHLQV
jgi:hypothetical protein